MDNVISFFQSLLKALLTGSQVVVGHIQAGFRSETGRGTAWIAVAGLVICFFVALPLLILILIGIGYVQKSHTH